MARETDGLRRRQETVADLPEIKQAEWHLRMAIQILAVEIPLDLAVEIAQQTIADLGREAEWLQ